MKASTIGEERRIRLRQSLLQFRDSEQSEMSFPATLSADERKYLHRVATELGLYSKSTGMGASRSITVRRGGAKVVGNNAAQAVVVQLPEQCLDYAEESVAQAISQVEERIQQVQSQYQLHLSSQVATAKPINKHLSVLRARYFEAKNKFRTHAGYGAMMQHRNRLPAALYRTAVTEVVRSNQVTLISGETGCGKSTQIPQFLYEDDVIGQTCKVIITQPRRISAIALAERVAFERMETVGDVVGYNIRFDSKSSPYTQLLFVTPGVLLRKLISDPELEEYSHIIIDEAHERDRYTEFLLILLRDLCERRKTLKLVLMSATMHTQQLVAYFGQNIPQVNVGGSIFPVQEFYLEHVLKFTAFTNASASGALLNTATYRCSACDAGPFFAAEELGVHAAFCFDRRSQNTAVSSRRRSEESMNTKLRRIADKIAAITVQPHPAWPVEQQAKPPVIASGNYTSAAEEQDPIFDDENDSEEEEEELPVIPADEMPTSDRYLLSEESAEYNNLLQAYQRSRSQISNDDLDVDYDLVVALLVYICTQSESGRIPIDESGAMGSILIFLPGWEDISALFRMLSTHAEFSNPSKYVLLQLHSSIDRKDQALVFASCHKGQRKIVLSTNIAETSLTIDDVTIVIDSGKVKMKTYDAHTKLAFLKTDFISHAAARQRKGRAGRTRSGVCYRLYSVLRSKHLSEFQTSELLRLPLEELVLQAKLLGVAPGEGDADDSVTSFLLKALDPPQPLAIQQAINLLQALQIMDAEERLNCVGQTLGHLSINPRLGRMLLLGCVLGCGPAVTKLCAVLSSKDPFVIGNSDLQRQKVNQAKQQLAERQISDTVIAYQALELFNASLQRMNRNQTRELSSRYELNFNTMMNMQNMAQQYEKQMMEIGLNLQNNRLSRNNGRIHLVLGLLTMGMYPDVALRTQGSKLYVSEAGAKMRIHNSSILSRIAYYRSECSSALELLCYQELVAISTHSAGFDIGGAVYQMLTNTPMAIYSLLLIAGTIESLGPHGDAGERVDEGNQMLRVDGWLDIALATKAWRKLQLQRELLQRAVQLLAWQSLLQQTVRAEGSTMLGVTADWCVGHVQQALERIAAGIEVSQMQCMQVAARASPAHQRHNQPLRR